MMFKLQSYENVQRKDTFIQVCPDNPAHLQIMLLTREDAL